MTVTTARISAHTPNHRLLRMGEVTRYLGISDTILYRIIADERFPGPIMLGRKTRARTRSDVDQWISRRDAARGEIITD
jgi:excisionase family DNA binding protein